MSNWEPNAGARQRQRERSCNAWCQTSPHQLGFTNQQSNVTCVVAHDLSSRVVYQSMSHLKSIKDRGGYNSNRWARTVLDANMLVLQGWVDVKFQHAFLHCARFRSCHHSQFSCKPISSISRARVPTCRSFRTTTYCTTSDHHDNIHSSNVLVDQNECAGTSPGRGWGSTVLCAKRQLPCSLPAASGLLLMRCMPSCWDHAHESCWSTPWSAAAASVPT